MNFSVLEIDDGYLGELAGRRYTQVELQSILRQAGWPADKIPIMAAIGMAESSGYAGAVNRRGEYSVGIWQININPRLRRPWTESQLKEPLFNAGIALQLYNERQRTGRNGLTHWGAYTDGRYRKFLSGRNASDDDRLELKISDLSPVSATTIAAILLGGAVILILMKE